MTNYVFESILKMFAIIAKADGINEEEVQVVERFLKSQFDDNRTKFFKNYLLNYIETIEGTAEEIQDVATEVCTELSIEQRFLIFIRLNELVRADGNVTPKEDEFLQILARIFHLNEQFLQISRQFVFSHKTQLLKVSGVAILDGGKFQFQGKEFNMGFKANSEIAFCFLDELGFFILKVLSSRDHLVLNNENVKVGVNYFLRPGSVLTADNLGQQLHFSTLWNALQMVNDAAQNFVCCEKVEYHHPNGKIGLHETNFAVHSGDLIAIMGPSGSGKSTLLNVLNGNFTPSKGAVKFNDLDIHKEKEQVKKYFGYVPQDDLLVEDLSVFQNLFYSAQLSLPELNSQEVEQKVNQLLKDLNLFHVKDLKVGNSLSNTISGGQRKRLNISLELIREPSVLFVDEPTSGLSSRDSEHIMNFLRELCFKGTIIFTVIHQPSSDIFKLFDQLILLDVGGYCIFAGNPIEAVAYFKKSINHITSHISACPSCGNINPEVIFDIVEGKVIDDYGRPQENRKNKPSDWYNKFKNYRPFVLPFKEKAKKAISKSFRTPGFLLQVWVFFKRDIQSKLANKQYIAIALGEPIALALILAFTVRYFPVSTAFESRYLFSENVNLPSFIFIAIIVSIFMGLTLSAEEIFKDQKILRREHFLQLSKFGYLCSKISIQFMISCIQTFLFAGLSCLVIGNTALFWSYFVVLFSCACFANMLALNISSSFPRIITIYILIPVLLIPQLILGGIIVNFDKMNPALARYGKVPFLGDLMASRWAFEAACISQFKDNAFDAQFFKINKEISKANFKTVYWLPEMNNITNELNSALMDGKPQKMNQAIALTQKHYPLLVFEIEKENKFNKSLNFDVGQLAPERISLETVLALEKYLTNLDRYYHQRLEYFQKQKDQLINEIINQIGKEGYLKLYQENHNEALEQFVRRKGEENRILHANGHLVQQIDPIYNDEFIPQNPLDYRAHFFSPIKQFMEKKYSTYRFNISVIWLMVFTLFLTLYFDVLKKMVEFKISKKN